MIKGLILKDLYVFKSYKNNIYSVLIIDILVIFFASFKMEMITTGTIIFLISFGLNSISTFSYDENADSNKYLLSLPLTRKKIVQAKYIFAIINNLLSFMIGFMISFIIALYLKSDLSNIVNNINICLLAFTGTSLLICTDIPCIYKWGVEKGRIQATIIPVVMVFILAIILFVLFILFPNIYYLIKIDTILKFIPIICLIINILLYVISYFISLKIFLKKEI